jgi:hypothetical protein
MYTEENRPMREIESRNKNSGAAFGTIFRILSVSKKKAETLTLFFSFKNHLHI